MILEGMVNSKIFEILDLSNEFWSQFYVRDTSTEKQAGLYEIRSIGNPNIVTITVNSKQYFEKYRDKIFNEKLKVLKRDTTGMHFEAYPDTVISLKDFTNRKVKNIPQNRFQIKKIPK